MQLGLLELGEIMLAASQRRLEIISRNVSNATTPGFRQSILFQNVIGGEIADARAVISSATDPEPGALRITGRPLDLAITGSGYFQVAGRSGVYYTRAGQFERAADGRLIDSHGLALRTIDGADLVVGAGDIEILADGVVTVNGVPTARIGVFETTDDAAFQALGGTLFSASNGVQEAADASIRQGALEMSNADMAAGMIEMMAALRSAEIAARVLQSYDSLIGQCVSTFGRTQR